MQRVMAYIDGFNLYHGMRSAGWKRFYWLNMSAFASTFLDSCAEVLVGVKYFTSMVVPSPTDPNKLKRQERYIDALRTLSDTEIFLGYNMPKKRKCLLCKRWYGDYEEKSTDVCMATHMLVDAYKDVYDHLLLVSGDGDLTVPLEMLSQTFPRKDLVVVFPPKRIGKQLQRLEGKGVCRCLHAAHTNFKASQFPQIVCGIHGYRLHRPKSWR